MYVHLEWRGWKPADSKAATDGSNAEKVKMLATAEATKAAAEADERKLKAETEKLLAVKQVADAERDSQLAIIAKEYASKQASNLI